MGGMRKYWTKILRADVDAVDVQSQHQRRRSLQKEHGGDSYQGSRNLSSCLPGVLVGKLELKGNPVSDLATGPAPGEAPRAGPRTAALGLGGCAGPRPQHRSIAARRWYPD